MKTTPTTPAADEQRLYERLAVVLETRERTGGIDTATIPLNEPDLAAAVQDYLAAADVVDEFAAGLGSRPLGSAPLPTPSRIGDYELLAMIGRGGAAAVYKARQIGLNRLVAVKMLHFGHQPGSLHDAGRMRFEAEAVAQLDHPGIVPIYEVGAADGRPYFSMQLYERGSLSGRLEEFVAHPRRAAELVAQISQAVQHAHERGILHRDLKPSNILLDSQGRPHVSDFGLAKRLADDQELTRTGELIGTPAYMAPERVAGSEWAGATTIATDVYGLGAILYALLAGRSPFAGETPVETLLAVGTTDVVPPSTLNPAVERDLEAICLKCLEKNPASRYATAAEVAADLERWRNGEPISVRETGSVERLRRWCRRHPVRATIGLATMLLLLLGAVGLSAGYLIVSDAYQDAEQHRESAELHAEELNRRLYVSQMSLAHRHLERGELVELKAVLDPYRDRRDLPGFEWQWLDREAQRMPRQLAEFSGHTHFLYGGAISPDGRTAATCGADGTLRIWDASNGTELRKFENGAGLSPAGVPYDENCAVFSPDGTLLASCGEDGGVRLWTLADGSRRSLTPVRNVEALHVAFSGDGRRVAAGWTDGHLQVWDVASGELRLHRETGGVVTGIGFLGTGNELATVDIHGEFDVWSLETGESGHSLKLTSDRRCLAISPDGLLIAAASLNDNDIRTVDVQSGRTVHVLHAGEGVRAMAFSPDGARIAATGNDGCVRIWSVADHALLHHFKAHATTVWNVTFSPDGNRLLTVSSDMTARIWNVPPRGMLYAARHLKTEVRQLAFSPDGRWIAWVGEGETLQLGNPADNAIGSVLPLRASTYARPLFIDGGRQLAFVDVEGAIQRWDCDAGQLLPTPPPPGFADSPLPAQQSMSLLILERGRLAALTRDEKFAVFDGRAWTSIQTRGGSDDVLLLASLPDRRTFLVRRASPTRSVLWRLEDDAVVEQLLSSHQVMCAAASPNGRSLALGCSDGTIELLDLPAGTTRTILVGHLAHVQALDFSRDGRTLASTSKDGTARLWNIATGTELFVAASSGGPVHSVAFAPDGRALAIGGNAMNSLGTLLILRAE